MNEWMDEWIYDLREKDEKKSLWERKTSWRSGAKRWGTGAEIEMERGGHRWECCYIQHQLWIMKALQLACVCVCVCVVCMCTLAKLMHARVYESPKCLPWSVFSCVSCLCTLSWTVCMCVFLGFCVTSETWVHAGVAGLSVHTNHNLCKVYDEYCVCVCVHIHCIRVHVPYRFTLYNLSLFVYAK